jgi:hypothetical protein
LLLVLLLVASSFQPALLLPASSRQPNGYIIAFDASQQAQSPGGPAILPCTAAVPD